MIEVFAYVLCGVLGLFCVIAVIMIVVCVTNAYRRERGHKCWFCDKLYPCDCAQRTYRERGAKFTLALSPEEMKKKTGSPPLTWVSVDAAEELPAGVVVKLKSGGPQMSISSELLPAAGLVKAQWFNDRTLQSGTFPKVSLMKAYVAPSCLPSKTEV